MDESRSGYDSAEPQLWSLHPRAVPLWRLKALFRGTVLTAAVLLVEWSLDLPLPFGLATIVLAVLVVANAIVTPPLRYRAWRFALREDDLLLRYGVLFRTSAIVPHVRIQHVDTHHGPLDRALGLADLLVYTAGSRGAIMTIPALARDDAESLRDTLAELSGAGDAV